MFSRFPIPIKAAKYDKSKILECLNPYQVMIKFHRIKNFFNLSSLMMSFNFFSTYYNLNNLLLSFN